MGTNLHRNTTGGKGETACKKTSPEQQEQERRRRKKKKKEKKRKKKKNIIIIFFIIIIIISLYKTRNKTHKSKRPRVRSPFASLKGALALTLHALIILSKVNVQR